MKSLTIVISFDVSKQIVPGSIPGRVASLMHELPVGLASDAVLNAVGLPSFQPNNNQYEGRIRVQRAF
jgi:hypothetical protein